ncbi:hypothetical protein G7Z17_g7240 [Cylindrodendrum hubeiense]|uniref:Uncharacterized protein n=1 Tax=Cylindrodendrum hubeiense TaxID=595255 RepID=A0A9P5LFH7_9HYPO|nr:hypothetical protein G7Z17_g7240 [Cylindrodendrum hubeiense]
MDHETRTTSFEKDAAKSKEAAHKSKTRSSSLLMISSGMTFLAAIPQRAGATTRRSLQFDQSLHDHPDEFYELHYSRLFVEVHALVARAFCQSTNPKSSPWLQEYPAQFIKYVELLARPDPHAGKWDRLLRDETERSFLLQATIMKIIDAKVFSSLLFGADPEHQSILQSTDASLVNAEGFRRSNIRAQTNRVYLGAKLGQPPLFWEEVDKLCTQVLALVFPTFAWTSETGESQSPSVQELYQWLHDVIAYAGWISVCTRLSPAIIISDWVIPGERYHVDQVNLSQDVYEHSKNMVQSWALKRVSTGSCKMTARVKISVAPKIIRYKPATDPFGREGTAKYTIMQPHVVYYQGRDLDHDEDRRYVTLPEHIHRLRDRKTVPRGAALVIMLVAMLGLWASFESPDQYAWRSDWRSVWQGLSPTSEPDLEP